MKALDAEAVRAWEEEVVIPTYPTPAPEKYPMFLDKRVYQGSSGRVYPNPVIDRVSSNAVPRVYRAVYLENEFVRIMILPEIGGRIHEGLDKTNGYNFFYRASAIKPALVGLLGPWISGGVEFNWPQHHRPSTFMPCDSFIEKCADGRKIVWLSEHEPMNRMKGMVGVCLHPGRSLIETKARLYNRTPFVQTFLWWANAGVRAHDRYQAFFPPDVAFVADHAKRAISSYPVARNFYYGVDYRRGVDISWYKNIPVPTSYMVTQSKYDFFGGYDHAREAGVVHYADHHIAPGKKLWTWGNSDFGRAWERELTDSDGPYVELMAGVYTDNQPDFSWLHPYETKHFSQFWYPIQKIGPVKNANALLAVNLEREASECRVGVCPTEALDQIRVHLRDGSRTLLDRRVSLRPGEPFVESVELPRSEREEDLLLQVFDTAGRELIRFSPETRENETLPAPATEPPAPEKTAIAEKLFLTGVHLDQYRHATRQPGPYWREALARDPEDARSNCALGILALRRGEFGFAARHFQTTVRRLTEWNPNPYDGEAFYHLGLAFKYQGKLDEAYEAFYKAVWNYAWRCAGYYELASIECYRGLFESALAHLDDSLETGASNLKTRNLKCAVLRRLGRTGEAKAVVLETMHLDPLDAWSRNEAALVADPFGASGASLNMIFRSDQLALDLAFDYSGAGLSGEAEDVLNRQLNQRTAGSPPSPMIFYSLADLAERRGDRQVAERLTTQAAETSPDYCFPVRLEEMLALESAVRRAPEDGRAHFYLGNLLYDKQRHEEAIEHWERAVESAPELAIAWRNLGVARVNFEHDIEGATDAYRRAFSADPSSARILYEFDQLKKRARVAPETRLAALEEQRALVDQRDDLSVELAALYNSTFQCDRALSILTTRRFHPWEGGEGLVISQYEAAHKLLGRAALRNGVYAEALEHFEAAIATPENLGEARSPLAGEPNLDFFTGLALAGLGRETEAKARWKSAAATGAEEGLAGCYRALALQRLGEEPASRNLLRAVCERAEQQMSVEGKIDYFATSLPNLLLFDEWPEGRQAECLFVRALALLGLDREEEAVSTLRKALDLDPSHLGARTEIKFLTSGQPVSFPEAGRRFSP